MTLACHVYKILACRIAEYKYILLSIEAENFNTDFRSFYQTFNDLNTGCGISLPRVLYETLADVR